MSTCDGLPAQKVTPIASDLQPNKTVDTHVGSPPRMILTITQNKQAITQKERWKRQSVLQTRYNLQRISSLKKFPGANFQNNAAQTLNIYSKHLRYLTFMTQRVKNTASVNF